MIQSADEIIHRLFALTTELEKMFPKRSFVPDGHVVESMGEVLAAQWFDLELLPSSSKIHNARTRDKARLVQIKTTQGDSLVFRGGQEPQHLLVIRLSSAGEPEIIYNGPGAAVYARYGNGQRAVRINTLRNIPVAPQDQLALCMYEKACSLV